MKKVRITKSNCTFVRPGDETEITTVNGVQRMWSPRLNAHENLSWVTSAWGVEYEEIAPQYAEQQPIADSWSRLSDAIRIITKTGDEDLFWFMEK